MKSKKNDRLKRFGVGVALQDLSGDNTVRLGQFSGYKPNNFTNPLKLGWYYDWGYEGRPVGDIEYLPLVGGYMPTADYPSLDKLQELVLTHPDRYPDGATWLIGNEFLYDDGRTIGDYVRDYRLYRSCLKKLNPTYRIATGAIMTWKGAYQGEDFRLIWDQCQSEHLHQFGEPIAADAYNIHIYVRPNDPEDLGVDIESFKAQIVDFRGYMMELGEGDKPLLLTEFGVLQSNTPSEAIERFMEQAFHFLQTTTGHPWGCPDDEGRLVQRWAWFVLNDTDTGRYRQTALYDAKTKRVKSLGQAYARFGKVSSKCL